MRTPVMLRLITSGEDWTASYIAAPDMPQPAMAPAPPQNLASFHQVVLLLLEEEEEEDDEDPVPPVLVPADVAFSVAAVPLEVVLSANRRMAILLDGLGPRKLVTRVERRRSAVDACFVGGEKIILLIIAMVNVHFLLPFLMSAWIEKKFMVKKQ